MAEFPPMMGLSLAGRNEHGAQQLQPTYEQVKERLLTELKGK